MDDIISQDEEKERTLAWEEGREKGKEEEQKKNASRGGGANLVKGIVIFVVLAFIFVIAAILTLSVSVINVSSHESLPYTTTYAVSFPEGETVTIGNSNINMLSFEHELISDIDGTRQKLEAGESRVITERRAVITTLYAITLIDTNFQVNLIYKDNLDNRAYFTMLVQTSKQVPDMLIRQLIPPGIDARPV